MSDVEERVSAALRRSAESAASSAVVPDPGSVRRHGAIRHRNHIAASSALALTLALAIALPLVLASVQGTGHPGSGRSTTTTRPSPRPVERRLSIAVDLAATPKGWVPVDYRGAQISVPSKWMSFDDVCDYPSGSGSVFVGRTDYVFCPSGSLRGSKAPAALLEPLNNSPRGPWLHVNGISVHRVVQDSSVTTYAVPTLDVNLALFGGKAQRVLRTLTYAPRAVVLAKGQAPAVPSSWKSVSFAGLRMSVPSAWAVEHTAAANQAVDGYICPDLDVTARLAGASQVLLDSNRYYLHPTCPAPDRTPLVTPADAGVIVNTGRFAPQALMKTGCRTLNHLRVCVRWEGADQFGVLVLGIGEPAVGGAAPQPPVEVSLGLAGNGLVARTILDSLRSTQRSSAVG